MEDSKKDQKDPTRDLYRLFGASNALLESTTDAKGAVMAVLIDNVASYLANGGSIDQLKKLER